MSDIQTIFQGLAANAPALAQTTAAQRCAKIQRLVDEMLARRDDINAGVLAELGTTDIDVLGQLIMVKAEADFVIKHLEDWMKPQIVKSSMMMMGKKAYVHYEPKGVILNLSTWNAPYAIGFLPAIDAIAAGNAFLLKPSELAPHSSRIIAEIVRKTFPENEFAVVEGGPEASQELLKQPFNHIYYTGGQNVGRIVMRAAAENFASVTLEMGGKNPVVIDETAYIADAAKKIAWGRLSNAGQVCVAPDYAVIHTSLVDKFVENFAKSATEMYATNGGFDKSTDYPRLVNQAHFARVRALIDDAVAKGAKIAFGGESDESQRFIAPTLLTNVSEDMDIMKNEIFGPVMAIVPYSKKEDAIAIIRRRPKPLALYIFARDQANAEYFLKHTSAGSTVFNHNLIQSGTNQHLAFGGVNHSGMGRVGGHAGFLEFSNHRSVVEEHPNAGDIMMAYPPYPEKHKKMMNQVLTRSTIIPPFIMAGIIGALKLRLAFRGR